MAETLLSPGVLARENDTSQITNTPAPIGAALIGPTVKGQPNVPRLITSFNQYLTYFGGAFISGSTQYTYFTSTAAFNYFENGGTSLWVTRVVTGSADFLPATSSYIITGSATGPTTGISPFTLQTLSWGDNMNSTSSLDAQGALQSGSANNLRWQIVNSNTASGTFNLLVRRGDDNTNVPIVLETWTNLSLDPTQPNYVEKVIGNQIFGVGDNTNTFVTASGNYPNKSNYITVKTVNFKTPNYFDNNGNFKPQYTASLPANVSGSFGGASGSLFIGATNKYYQDITSTNIQGLISSDYNTAISLMSNQDEYAYNVIIAPGLAYQDSATSKTQLATLINNTQNRGDAIAVVDMVRYGQDINTVTGTANTLDTSYAATYWPWLQTVDPITGEFTWVPSSTMIPAVYVNNDNIAAPWFAPAGLNRGGILNAIRAERKLTNSNRDTLYQNKVNPLATFPGTGVVVYGQKTLQTKASSLDRVNVRRLLIALKTKISEIANTLTFEQNTIATRTSFVSQVNPYLASVQQQQGLYAFKVIMDDSNNNAETIDRNQLVGQIYLQPTKTAEFIYLDFNILPTGATFPG
jgi:hypothetical protein